VLGRLEVLIPDTARTLLEVLQTRRPLRMEWYSGVINGVQVLLVVHFVVCKYE